MDYFYNDSLYLTTKESLRNDIGQYISTFKKDKLIKCDIQPIDEKAIKCTWGSDIKSNLQVFCDEELNVDDVVVYSNKIYTIEKAIRWSTYNIYAILESDVIINE